MPSTPSTFHFTADRGDARLRLDQVLVRRMADVARLSRTSAQHWIADGTVEVDGRVLTRPSSRVAEGAAVVVALPPGAPLRSKPQAEARALEILYEDDALIAVNKGPGEVVHPTYKQTAGTVLNAVLGRLRGRAAGDASPGMLTRLDKDTSGLVLVALSPGVHAAVQRDAAAGRVSKQYLAVVRGTPRPRSGRIVAPLARDPLDRRRVITSPDGAPSETRYEVIASSRGVSVVRCELVTGRTHQIRVHLSSKAWPIVGDRVYGEPSAAIGRQALHAWRITLPHPVTREPLTIEAPLAKDMEEMMKMLGFGLWALGFGLWRS